VIVKLTPGSRFFQNIHVSFLRTVPPYSHQADVWVEMLKQFKYRQLVRTIEIYNLEI
jgi:hypothetical protein